MCMVFTQPEMRATPADQLKTWNPAVWAGSAAAAAPTTGVAPAAADMVSLLTAAQFASHARLYQEVSTQAATVPQQLATTLGICAGSYAVTEAANVTAEG